MTVETEMHKIQHKLIVKGGGYLFLPEWVVDSRLANLSIPDEDDLSQQAQYQDYPIGAKLVKNDCIYRYSRIGETIAVGHEGFLKCNRLICPGKATNSVHSGYEGAAYAAIVAGQTYFDITDTAAYKNEFENGFLTIYDYGTSPAYLDRYKVIGNDASTGVYSRCYIAAPGFQRAIATTGVTFDLYNSPYYSVGSLLTAGNQSWKSALGMFPRAPLTSGYFIWLQTAGPCHGTGASTWPGQTAYQREVMANTDGSLIGITSTTYLYQRVGYLLSGTASDYGDVFFMLQLDQ